MASRKLNIEWTNKVEVWRDGICIERPAVWEGTNQDGTKVRVYITKIEEIDEETDKDK